MGIISEIIWSFLRFNRTRAVAGSHQCRMGITLNAVRQTVSKKPRHDKMVSLVDQMLSLNKQLVRAKTDQEKTSLQRQIDATDKQIDRLVYELYELTEEEIRLVEGL